MTNPPPPDSNNDTNSPSSSEPLKDVPDDANDEAATSDDWEDWESDEPSASASANKDNAPNEVDKTADDEVEEIEDDDVDEIENVEDVNDDDSSEAAATSTDSTADGDSPNDDVDETEDVEDVEDDDSSEAVAASTDSTADGDSPNNDVDEIEKVEDVKDVDSSEAVAASPDSTADGDSPNDDVDEIEEVEDVKDVDSSKVVAPSTDSTADDNLPNDEEGKDEEKSPQETAPKPLAVTRKAEADSSKEKTATTSSSIEPPSDTNDSDLAEDDDDEESEEGNRMSFLDHLSELRKRLMAGVIAVIITTILSFIFYSTIFTFLRGPIEDLNLRYQNDPALTELAEAAKIDVAKGVIVPISTDPLSLILILMKVALLVGLILSSPIVVYQLWLFLSPGLKDSERRAIIPLMVGGLFFFTAGAAFCYYIVFPLTLHFLVWLDLSQRVQPNYTLDKFIGLLITFMVIFGLVFELPLVASVLAMLRILHPKTLTNHWRYIIMVCLVLGALLSPGSDPISMIVMSGSLIFLYVISIFLTKALYPKDAPQ